MKGISFISGVDDSVNRLTHMFGHCLYRFESRIGCEGCEYNSDDNAKDVCELLEIVIKLQKNTSSKIAGNSLIRVVE